MSGDLEPKDTRAAVRRRIYNFLESEATEWSPILFFIFSIATFLSMFMWGFYSNFPKQMLPVLDTTIAASISLQLSLFIAACGLVWRVGSLASYVASPYLVIFRRDFGEKLVSFIRVLGFAVATPLLMFAALTAFLDLDTAFAFLIYPLLSLAISIASMYLQDRQKIEHIGFVGRWEMIIKTIRSGKTISNYEFLLPLGVFLGLFLSYQLGVAKFKSLSLRVVEVNLENDDCIEGSMMGSTQNGIVLLALKSTTEPEIERSMIFVPFGKVSSISNEMVKMTCSN